MNVNIVKEKLSELETPSLMVDNLNDTIICVDNYDVCCRKYLELSVYDNSIIIVKFPKSELTVNLILSLSNDVMLKSLLLECLIPDTSILDFDAFTVDWDRFKEDLDNEDN